ncbi:MAG: hypothetical protein AAF789_05385 [Bacteroidota bacterium]
MRGEERIIELLSEYLRKADKHEDEIKQNQEQIKQNQIEIKALRSDSLKNDIRLETLLKEILSLSKRVIDLEER